MLESGYIVGTLIKRTEGSRQQKVTTIWIVNPIRNVGGVIVFDTDGPPSHNFITEVRGEVKL